MARLDRRRGIDETDDMVVDQLAHRPADHDATRPQGVPPLLDDARPLDFGGRMGLYDFTDNQSN